MLYDGRYQIGLSETTNTHHPSPNTLTPDRIDEIIEYRCALRSDIIICIEGNARAFPVTPSHIESLAQLAVVAAVGAVFKALDIICSIQLQAQVNLFSF